MKLVARLPTNESVALTFLRVCRVRFPAKDSVAVKALRKALLAAKFPTNESVAVNPASRNFLVSVPTKLNVAEKVF